MTIYAVDPRRKIASNLDAVFGLGVSESLPLKELKFTFSKRTGRIKNVFHNDNLVGTLRTDGILALSIYGACLLFRSEKFKESCVTVSNEVAEYISEGKSVFCKHVLKCGNNVTVGSEVAVLNEDGDIIAVGKAVLSAKMIREFKRGPAAKVRESLKAGR